MEGNFYLYADNCSLYIIYEVSDINQKIYFNMELMPDHIRVWYSDNC